MSATPLTVPPAEFAFRKPRQGRIRTEKIRDEAWWARGVAMRRLRTQLQRIAPHFRMPVLTGETGSGKEIVARAHASSSPGRMGLLWQQCGVARL